MVSIVIPVYNGEKTIYRCLYSLSKQSYSDFEVIIVDDGSTDNSINEIMRFVNRDSRYKIYKTNNHGVSEARNYGIDRAIGDYITFVDCDDWVESEMLSKAVYYISKDIDIVYFNFFYNYKHKQSKGIISKSPLYKTDLPNYYLSILVPELCTYYDGVLISHETLGAAWGKFIKRSLVEDNQIRFNKELKLSEDAFFYMNCFAKAKNCVIIDEPLYHYSVNANSSNFRLREDILTQTNAYYDLHMKFASYLAPEKVNTYRSLIVYRSYYDLITRYVGHRDLGIGYIERYKMLKKIIRNDLKFNYVFPIPNGIALFKKVEIFALKYKLTIILLLLNLIRCKLRKINKG